jgi:hypothetical protein
MTRKASSLVRILSLGVLCIAVLSFAVAPAALVQQPRAGRLSLQAAATPHGLPVDFTKPVVYPAGGSEGASAVAVADLDGDGHLDLVMTSRCQTAKNCSHGEVSVLLGNGDGTFRAPVNYSSGGQYPTAVAVQDVNGDGYPDIVVSNDSENSDANHGGVSVLLANGDGTFQAAVSYSSGGSQATSVALGDVNGDGTLDLVVANGDGTVAILLGNGDGSFQDAITYSANGIGPVSVAVADLNGDGKLDLVVANCKTADGGGPCNGQNGTGEVSVLLGNGNGTFQSAVSYSSGGYKASSLAIADVNGDGKPDLVVANRCLTSCPGGFGIGGVSVLLGNGDGSFQSPVSYSSGAGDAISVAIADVNGDGHPDLVVANARGVGNRATGRVSILPGNGDGTFQRAILYDSAQLGTSSVAVADVNGDHRPDLIVTNQCANDCREAAVGILLNNLTVGATTEAESSLNPSLVGRSVQQHAKRASTTTTLTSDANPSLYGLPVTFTAQVTTTGPFPPTGRVTLLLNGFFLGRRSLNGGVATLTLALKETGSITAEYSGDDANASSTSSPLNQVVQGPFATTTTITASPNPSTYGQNVTVTATVTSNGPNPPSGSVHFKGVIWGNVGLSNGVATNSRSGIYPAGGSICAHYEGEDPWLPSWSNCIFERVIPADSTTTVVSSPNPSVFGQPVTITATVTSGVGSPLPGPVVFTAGGTILGVRPAENATLQTKLLPGGLATITAQFGGNDRFSGSSGSVAQTVNPVSTTTTLTSSKNPSPPGRTVTFTVNITRADGGWANSGTVTFMAGSTTLGTVTLDRAGIAKISTAALPVGSTVIQATYNGTATFGSSSAAITQTVSGS